MIEEGRERAIITFALAEDLVALLDHTNSPVRDEAPRCTASGWLKSRSLKKGLRSKKHNSHLSINKSIFVATGTQRPVCFTGF